MAHHGGNLGGIGRRRNDDDFAQAESLISARSSAISSLPLLRFDTMPLSRAGQEPNHLGAARLHHPRYLQLRQALDVIEPRCPDLQIQKWRRILKVGVFCQHMVEEE